MIRSIIFTFFLSLLGLSSQRLAFSQSISSFTISPFTTQSFYIWCTDQNGTFVPYCTPTATVGYYPFTGGHNHDDANHGVAANEQISNITSNGQKNTNTVNALIYFNASRIGEQEYVTVCANTCTTATANVQYSGFQQLGSYSQFVKIGATGIHPSNHWGTTSTLSSVVSITGRYAADYSGVSRYQPVGVNDIALAVALESDGDILVAGDTDTALDNVDFAIICLLGDAKPSH